MLFAQVNKKETEKIKQKLKEAKKTKSYRRLKIIQLSAEGKTVSELAKLFDLSEATVRKYIKSYNQKGLEGLKPNYGIGRPLKIRLSKTQWEELLKQSPSQFDKLQTGSRNWTQPVMVKYFKFYHGIEIVQPIIATRLKRLGLSWNRGKLKVTSPDPLYKVKRERIEKLKKK